MSRLPNKSITLIELLVAVSILGLLVIGLSNIDTFSHFQVISSDRRAKLQHDAAYVLEHMSRQIARAIGNERVYGAETVIQTIDNDPDAEAGGVETRLVKIYIDAGDGTDPDGMGPLPPSPPNGKREAPKNNPESYDDHWIAYRFYPASAQIRYCGRCRRSNCKFNGPQCMDGVESLTTGIISNFSLTADRNPDNTLQNNSVQVQLTACWDPDGAPAPCGTSVDNPRIEMSNSIKMPAVPVN